jgi:hypothetical protein
MPGRDAYLDGLQEDAMPKRRNLSDSSRRNFLKGAGLLGVEVRI